MKTALVLSPGIGTVVLELQREGFKVYATKISAEYAHLYKKYFPGVSAPPPDKHVDLLVSFNDTVTHQTIQRYHPKMIVALPSKAVAWTKLYHYTVFDLNCSLYNSPQSKKQPFLVGLRLHNGQRNVRLLNDLVHEIGNRATQKPLAVNDVLKDRELFLLPPFNGRSLFSAHLPAPEILPRHWPVVIDFKPGVMDISKDKGNATSLSVEEFALIQGVEIPLHTLNRKDAIKAIAGSVPTGVLKPVFQAVTKTLNK